MGELAPDIYDAMELCALGPHVILVKVNPFAGYTSSFTNM